MAHPYGNAQGTPSYPNKAYASYAGVAFPVQYKDDPEGLVLYLAVAHSHNYLHIPAIYQPHPDRIKDISSLKFATAEPIAEALLSLGVSSSTAHATSDEFVTKSESARRRVESALKRTWQAGVGSGRSQEDAFLLAFGFAVTYFSELFEEERTQIIRYFALRRDTLGRG
ncbi:hypothetical protein M422DRAFT_43067 [Sphaerobolus stellatus SS14]|nr:hypothetical protein M422DRAFT_43067 [Sphaerobolus stellatus SS14]